MKNTSGRICAKPHRATVARARQQTAKPVLNSGEGWEIPCQPRRNSSINFVIGIVTSPDQQIQNKADHRAKFRDFTVSGWRQAWHRRPAIANGTGSLALSAAGGNIGAQPDIRKGERHGTAGRQGRGHHRRDERHRTAHRGDIRRRRRENRHRRTPRAGRRGAGQKARRQLHLPPDRRHGGRRRCGR